MTFDGKCVVVTGSGSGIGKATALAFAQQHARVVVADISASDALETKNEIESDGGEALAVTADVARASDVEALFDAALRRWNGVDVLINNAGILRLRPALEMTEDDWDLTLDTNLKSVFLCSTRAARIMVSQGRGGRIVSVSSIHALLSEPNALAYTAAKGGIEAMSRTLASELAPYGITVNWVRPGATWTSLSTPLYTEDVIAALHQRIPLREIAQPHQIAAAILFLASDSASYTTGSAIDVDGGYLMDGSLPSSSYMREVQP